MFDFITKKVCLVAVGVVLGSEVLWKLFKRVRKQLRNRDFEVNEVLFFPDSPMTTFGHNKTSNQNVVINKTSSISRLLQVISGCKKSLDMCLFLITLKDMASLAIRLMQDGVRVRLIVDHSNLGIAGCQVGC